MGYQALYRVWRPKQLTDVVGQEHITKTVKNALVQEKLSHAYLFTGPRGTGKTSAAKIISKAVNCLQAPTDEPCNECEACRGITDGSVVDVIEIDAASNNGVDEIRDIRDKVKFAPSAVRYKVYIIDEVHMLTTGAFNALLKTLEEPPKHVIFILATTEPHKIPLTIISRCQRFDFKRITNRSMVERMKFIISHYDTKVSDDALAMIARVSEGGMRDALSLLDQAISFSEGEVTVGDVLTITGAVSQEVLLKVAESLVNNDVLTGLKGIDEIIASGKEPTRFIEDLIFFFRDMLLFQTAPELTEVLDRVTVNEQFKNLVKDTSLTWIYHAIDTLNQILHDMKWSSHPKIFLEIAVVKLCSNNTQQPIEVNEMKAEEYHILQKKVEALEQKLANLANHSPEKATVSEIPTKKKQTQFGVKGGGRAVSNQVKEMLKKATKQDLQRITSSWGEVMEVVKKQSVPAHAWLSDCKPVASSNSFVLLSFQNEMHRDMIDTKFRAIVESSLEKIIGTPFTVLTLLTKQWETVKDDFMREQRGDSISNNKEPIIEEAIKLVGSDLVEIID